MLTGLEPFLDVPFAFFGHCWSTLAAYEATAFAERSGRMPARLFVSSDSPPHRRRTAPMGTMDEVGLAAEVAKTIRALGKDPHPELMSIYVKILRGDIALRQRYTVSPPLRLAVPITVFGWTADTEVRQEQLAGWSDVGAAKVTMLAGDQNRCTEGPTEMLDAICAGMAA